MKAYELLSDKSKWCKGAQARNTQGYSVSPNSCEAVSWCVIGAIVICSSELGAMNKIREHLGISAIGAWNDSSTHEEVIKVLKELNI